MKTKAEILKELKSALSGMAPTPTLMAQAATGSVTRDDLIQFYRDALALAIERAYADFADRNGGVLSIRQVSADALDTLARETADGSLKLVQDAATKAPGQSTDEAYAAMKRAVSLSSKDAAAVENYADELKNGSAAAKRRNLRDRRFDSSVRAGVRVPAAKRERMVQRYRTRLEDRRAGMIARAAVREAHEATLFAHYADLEGQEGVEQVKIWKKLVTQADSRVRHSHDQIVLDYPDGIPIDQAFMTQWGALRFAHDPQAHEKDRAGCRCRTAYFRYRPKG